MPIALYFRDGLEGELEISEDHLKQWIGKLEVREDQVTAAPLAAMNATLDREARYPAISDPIPPLASWLYFLPLPKQSSLSNDGHAKKGGFLPPVPLPRRMFAGGKLEFHQDLRVGQAISRKSEIQDVAFKTGKTGSLIFVKVHHAISNEHGLAVSETNDLVFRDNPKPGDPVPPPKEAPQNAQWVETVVPNEVMLFRYSALTFNGHRIHFDRPYATHIEGYAGLVVHGPLIATFLADLAGRKVQRRLTKFSFRAVSPLFDTSAFTISGRLESSEKLAALWASNSDGRLAMEASASFE